MSASREKKSRQSQAEVFSEKQLKAQQEAAQAKRNTILYSVIGGVCAVAAAALLIWNSGIFQSREAAVTVAGKDYSVTELQYHYNSALNQYYMYSQYGIDVGFDPAEDPAEQMYNEAEGITWHDQLLDEAVTALAQTKVLAAQAEAEGVKLSEEGAHEVEHAMDDLVAASARNGFSTVNSYLKALFGRGMNKATYQKYMRESQLAYEFQTAYTEQLTYTDEQLDGYYAENKDTMDLFDYNFAVFNANEDETKDSETLLKEAKDKADAVLGKVVSGVDFMEAAGEGEHAEGEEHEHIDAYEERAVSGAYLDASIAEWLQDEGRKAGDATVIEDADAMCCYVVEFMGRTRNEEVGGDVRHILVAAEQDEGATAPTEEQYEAAKTKAEELLEQWKNGDATEESFAALATAESADPGSAANGGLYENVSSQSGFIADFTNWAIDPARKAGDTGLVKNTGSSTKGWHIMYFVGQNEPVWKGEVRTAKASEDAAKWLEGLVEAAEVTRLDAVNNVK